MGENMAIRLGYIGNSKLLQNCSTDKTVSVLALNKIESNQKKIAKLKRVAKSNINSFPDISSFLFTYTL